LCAAAPAWGLWGSGAQTVADLQKRYDAGRFQEVIAELEPDGLQSLRGENLRRGYVLLGSSYDRTGHPEKTLSVYQLGVRLFPEDEDLLSRLAVLLHQAGLEEQSQPLFERLVRLEPKSAYGHLGLAQIDRALGFLDRSAEHYERALEALPGRGDLWREYGEDLWEARDYPTAELAMRRALALLPGDQDSLLDLALILHSLGRTDEAVAGLADLVRAGHGGALRARALWLLEEGRDDEARAAAQTLLSRVPADPVALYVRARLELKAGRESQALQDLRRAATQSAEAPFAARVCAVLAQGTERRR